MEVPAKIRFDFLIFLLGFLLIITPIISQRYGFTISTPVNLGLVLIGGLVMVFGLGFLKYEYYLEIELKELDYAQQKYNYILFFKEKGLLSQNGENKHLKIIKKLINK